MDMDQFSFVDMYYSYDQIYGLWLYICCDYHSLRKIIVIIRWLIRFVSIQ